MVYYNVASLERLLENAEHNDTEAHKLYNNLGLAHAASRNFRLSLNAHREEKKICKRLLSDNPNDTVRHLDLAIAYRRCGDAMIKLDRLVDGRNVFITSREEIIRLAQSQHVKGLNIARSAPVTPHTRPAVRLEMQAASAALAQSSLALALQTHEAKHFIDAASASVRAARLADRLIVGHAGLSYSSKQSLLLGIALNHAIALSGLGEKKHARTLLQTVAIRAMALDDRANLVRAFSNLSEEASEDNEWNLCEAYVREWVRRARREEDHCDESDALRKLAVALRENGDLRGAEESLQRSLSLPSSDEGHREAELFLTVIQQDIEEHTRAQIQYHEFQRKAEACKQGGDYVEEARSCIAAGNNAFALRKPEKVADILTRYFELVDDFGCDPVITGVEDSVHNAAIANMGESLWRLKRFEDAVKWATRELSVYDGDLPGQAQAWCNLGVYLDDLGKKEKAMDALQQSIDIAKKCRESDTLKRAEDNLLLVKQELKGAEERVKNWGSLGSKINDAEPANEIACVTTTQGCAHRSFGACKRKHSGNVDCDEESNVRDSKLGIDESDAKSIIMVSSQAMKKTKIHDGREDQREQERIMRKTSTSTKHSMRGIHFGGEQSMSFHSHDIAVDLNTRGLRNIVDLPKEYRAMCGGSYRQGIPVRPMIVSAFRDVSSALLSREACDQYHVAAARLNLSGLLVDSDDVLSVFQTLSLISGNLVVSIDLSLNPVIGASIYDRTNMRKLSSSYALHAVKQLDLSCAGLSAETVCRLSDSLSDHGPLCQVVDLNLSKNALGRYGRSIGAAVGRLICRALQLRSIDLSLNMLPNNFFVDFTEKLVNYESRDTLASSTLQNVNLCLNNRRVPTGLLETNEAQTLVDQFLLLFKLIPKLGLVNVRACGASLHVRRALRSLSNKLSNSSRTIITVSDENLDDDI